MLCATCEGLGFGPNASKKKCVFDSALCPSNTVSTGTFCKKCPDNCNTCRFNSESDIECQTCPVNYAIQHTN